jgi:hypothetical protein
LNRLPQFALSALAAVTFTLSGCQTTGSGFSSPVAIAGVPLRLAHFASLNPDCSSAGVVVARVAKPADHGVVTARVGEGYTNFVAANPRQHCNFHPTSGVNAVYTPDRGYAGPDSVALDVIFPTGEERQYTYNLNVKP